MKITPALVVAVIALIISLGGTSYAVTKLPRNSVGTTQLANNAVIGGKVKDGSLGASDFSPGSLGNLRGPAGPAGASGLAGAAGATGARGPTGVAGADGTLAVGSWETTVFGNNLYNGLPNVVMGQIPLSISEPANIVVNASLIMKKADSGVSFIDCYAHILTTSFGETMLRWVPQSVGEVTTLSLTKTISVAAGDHTVEIICENVGTGGTVFPVKSTISAIAFRR
jgi:hypothetical protein